MYNKGLTIPRIVVLRTCVIASILWVCLAKAQTSINVTLAGTVYNVQPLKENATSSKQCYVDVYVFNSSSMNFGLANATVTALSGQLNIALYSQDVTDVNGHTCLPVTCRDEVRLFVEKYSTRISALNKQMQEKNLPPGYIVYLENYNEVIRFYAYPWGILGGRNGPVYNNFRKPQCLHADANNFHFGFSYISEPARLYATFPPPTSIVDPNARFAWHYNDQKMTCYIKIGFQVESSQVKITTASIENNEFGQVLGMFDTGPVYNISSSNTIDRAACIEYRCPGIDIDTGDDINTFLIGNISFPDGMSCCVKNSNPQLFAATQTDFRTVVSLQSGSSYGSENGIYTSPDPVTARARCYTGHDYLGIENVMNVTTGTAFEYKCTKSTDKCNDIVQNGLGK